MWGCTIHLLNFFVFTNQYNSRSCESNHVYNAFSCFSYFIKAVEMVRVLRVFFRTDFTEYTEPSKNDIIKTLK